MSGPALAPCPATAPAPAPLSRSPAPGHAVRPRTKRSRQVRFHDIIDIPAYPWNHPYASGMQRGQGDIRYGAADDGPDIFGTQKFGFPMDRHPPDIGQSAFSAGPHYHHPPRSIVDRRNNAFPESNGCFFHHRFKMSNIVPAQHNGRKHAGNTFGSATAEGQGPGAYRRNAMYATKHCGHAKSRAVFRGRAGRMRRRSGATRCVVQPKRYFFIFRHSVAT
jgi:hypothetical protein